MFNYIICLGTKLIMVLSSIIYLILFGRWGEGTVKGQGAASAVGWEKIRKDKNGYGEG